MALESVHCPTCDSTDIIKHGKTAEGKQRYKGRNPKCTHHRFVLEYSYRSYLPAVKQQICEMALNGSGVRDPARVLAHWSELYGCWLLAKCGCSHRQ